MIFLDDGFFQHPKVFAAGGDATLVYLQGLGWLKQQRSTDGRIPKVVLPILCPLARGSGPPLAGRLVEVRLWHDEGDHWLCHGYVERNAKAIAKSEQARGAANARHAAAEKKASKRIADAPPERCVRNADADADAMRTLSERNAVSVSQSTVHSPQGTVHTAQITDTAPQPRGFDLGGEVELSGPQGAPPAPPADRTFDEFWQEYPRRDGKRIGKGDAERAWARLKQADRDAALLAVVNYADACNAPGGPLAQDAFRWLAKRRWEEWATPAVPRRLAAVNGSGASFDDFVALGDQLRAQGL